MHSSTSSSEPQTKLERTALRASAVLLACALLLVLGVEAGTRAFIHDVSNLLNRMRRESRAATQLRSAADSQPLLILGNSLLVAGVDVPALDSAMRPGARVSRFAIENTSYFDWHFGLRRLMADGARPKAVALFFEPRHLLRNDVNGEIFAHYLMQRRDILRVSDALDLSPTATSDMFFSNVSDFWGLRREIRKNLLGRLLPSFPALAALMTRGTPPPRAAEDQLIATGAERLSALRTIVEPHDVRFVLALMPPVSAREADVLRRIGQQQGVAVVAPLTDTQIETGDYDRDGYHLSSQGRTKYPAFLARDLSSVLPAADRPLPRPPPIQ